MYHHPVILVVFRFLLVLDLISLYNYLCGLHVVFYACPTTILMFRISVTIEAPKSL